MKDWQLGLLFLAIFGVAMLWMGHEAQEVRLDRDYIQINARSTRWRALLTHARSTGWSAISQS